MLVEVCANSLTSAKRALMAGADRIELCAELGIGGITPSWATLKSVLNAVTIPVHVLIRPRSGHFTYTDDEFLVMKKDVQNCLEMGAGGIVSGVLHTDAGIDLRRTEELVQLCGELPFTFHRAFDWVPFPLRALTDLESIGVKTVLTSGKHLKAIDALEQLVAWQKATNMTIMAGGGITPENAHKFKNAGLHALHLSGTDFENPVNINRKIPMNSTAHLAEHHVAYTQQKKVETVVKAVK